MQTIEIKCDECEADLTYTGNCVDYRLVLAPENIAIRPGVGAVTAMGIYPDLKRPHHFCRLACLDRWRDRERHYNKLRRERSDNWAEERGTVHPGGMRSYPCPPQETIDAWDAECRAAAVKAFPRRALGQQAPENDK